MVSVVVIVMIIVVSYLMRVTDFVRIINFMVVMVMVIMVALVSKVSIVSALTSKCPTYKFKSPRLPDGSSNDVGLLPEQNSIGKHIYNILKLL